MKILVAGSEGQVGRQIIEQSKKFDFDVIALRKIDLDITDVDIISNQLKVYKPDIIINAAAFTDVDGAEEDQDSAYRVNYEGPKNLAELCRKQEILLVHISTDYVFDGKEAKPYSEEDKTNPINVYGCSKLKGEEVIRSILTNHIILRTSWVFGIEGNNFVKTILNLGRKNKEISVVSDQFGCPTSASSIALAIFAICLSYSNNKVSFQPGTYNFTGYPETSWLSFANEILKKSEELGLIDDSTKVNSILSKDYSTKSKKPKNSTLSSDKIKGVFDIKRISWKEELIHVLEGLN